MTTANGKLICSATSGKVLCSPTTGKLLYGVEEAVLCGCEGDCGGAGFPCQYCVIWSGTGVFDGEYLIDWNAASSDCVNPTGARYWNATHVVGSNTLYFDLIRYHFFSGAYRWVVGVHDSGYDIDWSNRRQDPQEECNAIGLYPTDSHGNPGYCIVRESCGQWCGELSTCSPDLSCQYMMSISYWGAIGEVHWVSGGIGTNIHWYGSSGTKKMNLWWAYKSGKWKWYIQAQDGSGPIFDWTKAGDPYNQCAGPEGVYNGILGQAVVS